MDLHFQVSAHVARPVEQVFEAVADPEQLSRYFTTGGAQGRLEAGATVWWDFADFPGAFPVEVEAVEPNRRIVLHWAANNAPPPDKTVVTFGFEPLANGRTRITVSERGWRESEAGLKASYGNCMGWSQMLCALKGWLEHGINLREGMYR